MDAATFAELIMVFFSGLCIEQNMAGNEQSTDSSITHLMQVVRGL